MKIAVIGYGRMGKIIKQVALNRGHSVITIDPEEKADFKEINKESLKGADVAIDFTIPAVALENAKLIAKEKVNIVMGTTGWYDKIEKMKSITKDIGFIWSGNFSIGVNMFFRVIKEAAKIANKVPEYDIGAYELHHNQKKDSPSGTAEMLGKILIENIKRKTSLVFDKLDRKPKDDELHVASMRAGSIPGTHTVIFDSPADSIELKHTARSREGFALGSVLAAEFIKGKKGFYQIDDLMDNIIGGQ